MNGRRPGTLTLQQKAGNISALNESILFWSLSMYAVFKTGGKQYKAAPGDVIQVEKLDADNGASVELDEVLMVADGDEVRVGSPTIEGGKVTAEVVGHGRGDKVRIIKFRRRKHHMKRMGHRQHYTEIKITGIEG
jgi:large subunit ribosomal protein L21